MESVSNKLLVIIDKKLQSEKREKLGNLFVPEHLMDYTNNLQFGTVFSFSKDVKKIFTTIEIGDIAIIDHSIENKVESTEVRTDEMASSSNDKYLVETDNEGNELRYLKVYDNHKSQLFGLWKNSTIIPSKGMIFCYMDAHITGFQLKNGIYINSKKDVDIINTQLEIASHEMKEWTRVVNEFPKITESIPLLEEAVKKVISLQDDIDKLTRRLNKVELAELTVLFTNPNDDHNIKRGDVVLMNEKYIYPIDLFGNKFLLIRNEDWVQAKINK